MKEKTGVTPGIYTSKSVCFAYDWSGVAKAYPLWVAQYPNYEETGFKGEPWTDGWDFGAWSSPLIFQYASTGRIARYAGHLDLDLFYGSKADWLKWCKASGASKSEETKGMAISRANVAAQIMEHLRNCPEHGYSQPGRHGTSGYCSVATDAGTIKVKKGDRDCSSAICEAWELALKGTAYDGLITRYNWTGGMREMFVGSELFSWKPMSFNASRGDIYLDEQNHTAMCARNDSSADLLAEFSISETGGIDGTPGDQTGCESWVHDYYTGHWDGILHYNGKAGGGTAASSAAPSGSVSDLAKRVIAGEFGNGDARKAALGSRYDEVQDEVNRILQGGGSSNSYDVDALARRVIAGEFGNGDARKRALGDKYDAVQKHVNEILGAVGTTKTSVDVDAMARGHSRRLRKW